jgi:hypothetical protein
MLHARRGHLDEVHAKWRGNGKKICLLSRSLYNEDKMTLDCDLDQEPLKENAPASAISMHLLAFALEPLCTVKDFAR